MLLVRSAPALRWQGIFPIDTRQRSKSTSNLRLVHALTNIIVSYGHNRRNVTESPWSELRLVLTPSTLSWQALLLSLLQY